MKTTIAPRFDELEREAAQLNHKRVTDAFDAFTEKLQTATQDYAFWDETYRFMQGEKVDEFIASNLQPEFKAVSNLGVNALVFIRKDGAVQWGAAYNLESQEPIEGMVKEIAHFSRSHAYLAGSAPVAERGLIRTSKGLMLVAIAPVLKSDQSGEPLGKVVSAKLLDVEAVKKLTGVAFELEEKSAAKLTGVGEGVELRVGDDRITSLSRVNSLVGRPLAQLSVYSPRDVSRAGYAAIRSAMLNMIAAGIIAISVLWLFLRRSVVARVDKLRRHFASAGSNGNIKQTDAIYINDEIGELAQSFNAMAEQVNQLRDALADSSYVSGLSEWATGTLHNVRNGLVPVTTTTWQVEKLFDGAWIKNIEKAAEEHAVAETATDRREKLNAYLIGSASRFVETANRTKQLTDQINKASQQVLDMVSEFERYAHRKTVTEAVDVLPLLKSAVDGAGGACAKEIDFVLPAGSATVAANNIILRQVISNIVINAIEAVEGQPQRGRIEIKIENAAGKNGLTQISVSDNGEGISAERLPDIFKRGFSSRRTRAGGLGLHWCANALKVFGGSILAASPGAGRGAVMTIELPAFRTNQQEAA